MQLFGLVNTMLAHDRTTAERDLSIARYAVIPLSPNSGVHSASSALCASCSPGFRTATSVHCDRQPVYRSPHACTLPATSC